MEHIEEAGVHSGDSACSIPPKSIPQKHIDTMEEYTKKIAIELKVIGLMNMQYAIADDKVYVLEANPRASRTVPLVSKVTNVSMAAIATKVMLGKKLKDMNIRKKKYSHVGIKEAVFPFNMLPEVDPLLGPEMRSTGEVLGMADSFGLAFFKAQDAAKQRLPTKGTALVTVAPKDHDEVMVDAVKTLISVGFKVKATEGTKKFLSEKGVETELIKKMHEGRPNIIDAVKNKEIALVINTPIGKASKHDDSYIRKASIKYRIPYITTAAAAKATAEGIKAYIENPGSVKSLQEYHKDIEEI
jgi:carbamoyl-phosphate synthase large subunit